MSLKFPYPLIVGDHPETGMPVIGFSHEDMFIFDARVSDCGRFSHEPESYGLTNNHANLLDDLNAQLEEAETELRHALWVALTAKGEALAKEINEGK
jgi:hypothetical protein